MGRLKTLKKVTCILKIQELEMNWPPKSELEKEFPNLYARYWDDTADHGEGS